MTEYGERLLWLTGWAANFLNDPRARLNWRYILPCLLQQSMLCFMARRSRPCTTTDVNEFE